MTRVELPWSDQIQTLPYYGQTLLACRFLRRVALSLFAGDEKAVAVDFCNELESIARDGAQQQFGGATLQHLPPQLLTWKPSQMALAFDYGCDSVASLLESKSGCTANRVSHFVMLSLLEVYNAPRFSRIQLAILLKSDLAQLIYVCQEAKLKPWDPLTDYVLTRLTPCHALELVDPPIALEDEFR
jgi:hypothetical protein